jgi:hypothetical protein
MTLAFNRLSNPAIYSARTISATRKILQNRSLAATVEYERFSQLSVTLVSFAPPISAEAIIPDRNIVRFPFLFIITYSHASTLSAASAANRIIGRHASLWRLSRRGCTGIDRAIHPCAKINHKRKDENVFLASLPHGAFRGFDSLCSELELSHMQLSADYASCRHSDKNSRLEINVYITRLYPKGRTHN